jgi:hypothetical protein
VKRRIDFAKREGERKSSAEVMKLTKPKLRIDPS